MFMHNRHVLVHFWSQLLIYNNTFVDSSFSVLSPTVGRYKEQLAWKNFSIQNPLYKNEGETGQRGFFAREWPLNGVCICGLSAH